MSDDPSIVALDSPVAGGVYRLVVINHIGARSTRRNCSTCVFNYRDRGETQCTQVDQDPNREGMAARWCASQFRSGADESHWDHCPAWKPARLGARRLDGDGDGT